MPVSNRPHPNNKMTAPDFLALRYYLEAQGFTHAQIGQAIGAAASNRTYEQIAQALRTWLRVNAKKNNS